MTEQQSLSARQLLEAVYDLFKKRLDGREFTLTPKVMVLIADDSDYHRTRQGYSGYETVVLATVGGKEWAIAFGIACGDYPADPYNCDITAVPISADGKSEEEVMKEIHDTLERKGFHQSSLIVALDNGSLVTIQRSTFSRATLGLLVPRIQNFIAQNLENNPEFFHLDLRPVVKSPVLYKPEFVEALFEVLCTVLSSS